MLKVTREVIMESKLKRIIRSVKGQVITSCSPCALETFGKGGQIVVNRWRHKNASEKKKNKKTSAPGQERRVHPKEPRAGAGAQRGIHNRKELREWWTSTESN